MIKHLKIRTIGESDRQAWNEFVADRPSFGLLQSYEWGELKAKLGWKVIRLAVVGHGRIAAAAQMLVRPVPGGLFSLAYIPRGPLVDWADRETTTCLLDALNLEARRHRAICLRIEPPLLNDPDKHRLLQSYGFNPVEHTNQPRCSMIVDLPADMNELFMALPSSTRYNIRKSQRKGVSIEVGTEADLPAFYALMQVTSDRGDFSIRSLDYYEHEWRAFSQLGQARLLVAYHDGTAIAAQMPFYFGEHAATFHAGSLSEYGNLKAGYLMMWTAMCWAQERGCRTFDLWGIPDEVGELTARGEPIPEGKTGGLWGVYYYKQAFRGQVVYYVGAYDYVYTPLPYQVLEFATSHLGSLDRLAQVGDRLSQISLKETAIQR
jgi:lipid II:glycine glycyltransferase (peptidoglycan interpeptide bridge formation enzyme)